MNKLVQRLLRNSLINRNWIVLSNYSTTSAINFSPDSLATKRFDESFKRDGELTSKNSFMNFVERIEENDVHTSRRKAIESLNELYTSARKQKISVDLKRTEGFEDICNVILKEARFLNTYEIIQVLNILTFFDIPPQTAVMTTLLQSLFAKKNKLSIKQLMMVYFTLINMKETYHVNYLKKAVIRIFAETAKDKITSESPDLIKLLKFSDQINDKKTITHIINILANTRNKIKVDDVVDVFHAICVLPTLTPSCKRMLFDLNNVIVNNSKLLQMQDAVHLLHYISDKVYYSQTEFYNLDVIKSLVQALLYGNSSVRQKLYVLRLFNKIQYSCPRLINQTAEEILYNPDICKNYMNPIKDTFLKACIIADHKPTKWEQIEELIKKDISLQDFSINQATSIAFHMLSLDSYQPELLETVFKLCNSLSTLPNDTLLNISRLYNCVKVLYPDYNGVMPDENKLNELNRVLLHTEDPRDLDNLRESLETAAGGAEYVKHGLRTRFGESVDAVVVQPDNSLMNVSSCDNAFAEELTSFPDCTKILFFALPKKAFSINEKNMLTTVKMLLKTVETLPGFSTFIVNPYKWANLTSTSRVSYLEEAIKSKIGSNSTN